jgi:hypothetical protein
MAWFVGRTCGGSGRLGLSAGGHVHSSDGLVWDWRPRKCLSSRNLNGAAVLHRARNMVLCRRMFRSDIVRTEGAEK